MDATAPVESARDGVIDDADGSALMFVDARLTDTSRLVTSRENVSLQLQNKEDLMFSDWYN